MVSIGGTEYFANVQIGGYIQGALYTILAIVGIIIFALILIWALYKRKYIYAQINLRGNPLHPIIEIRDKGIGKFRRNRMFFDMIEVWWKPSEWEYLDREGRRLEGASDNDLKDVNGHKGFWTRQKGDDPKILVPISELELKNDHILASIADADLKEAARHNIEKGERESSNTWNQYGAILINFTMMIILIIGLILVINFANGIFDKIFKLMGEKCAEFAASSATAASHLPSAAP